MSTVVFTGKGLTRTGVHLTRDEWTDLANARGYSVTGKIGFGVDYLVASRANTTKARDARRYDTEVITYEQFQDMFEGRAGRVSLAGSYLDYDEEGNRRVVSAPDPALAELAECMEQSIYLTPEAPRLLTEEQVGYAAPVWAALTQGDGLLAGDVGPVEWTRKPGFWDDVHTEVEWAGIAALGDRLPRFLDTQLWEHGDDQGHRERVHLPFDYGIYKLLDDAEVYVFIVHSTHTGLDYLVNTEGYCYCRYATRIRNMLTSAGVSREPMATPQPQRKRRAIRLD